ncbi:CinA family protein [Noviherbaspirillum galbum]|uniref:CinA family protein n=1 Tax=Noviherbaspirillum galbum TaxID=2709383 RepID=A0A6B3STP3_9BURK|nr:CinA family protein [Noviherbaspirillum galbum]NEX64107.1 CinA family protein [Noviherbaspirillum galbum]
MNHQLDSVLRYLRDNGLKVVTAESCTAGLIASTLAEQPGVGPILECAFVTYSVDAKVGVLGVSKETIDRCNLTSEEVAREMAEGALRISHANLALSDTGLAGPSNGDSDIPVGTVCFGWSFQIGDTDVRTFTETRKFDGERNEIRKQSADYAISRIWHYHNELTGSGK